MFHAMIEPDTATFCLALNGNSDAPPAGNDVTCVLLMGALQPVSRVHAVADKGQMSLIQSARLTPCPISSLLL
jgi:hypothetical protein